MRYVVVLHIVRSGDRGNETNVLSMFIGNPGGSVVVQKLRSQQYLTLSPAMISLPAGGGCCTLDWVRETIVRQNLPR